MTYKKSNIYYANLLVSFNRKGYYNNETLLLLGAISCIARRKHMRLSDAISSAIGNLYENNTHAYILMIEAGLA